MGVHEARICYRDTDDNDTLKVLTLDVSGGGTAADIKTPYPIVMGAVVREQPIGNPVVNEISGHDAYTCYCAPDGGGGVNIVFQGSTLKGGQKQVSRKVVPAVGTLKDEPVEADLADAVASCGDVSWPSAKNVTNQEESTARTLLGIP
jgi:hypothetical protein